ncbi:glycoside hydrolase family 19 protein [Pusillimonas noertemannii]|nr:glycoside hydrolase family 19 protein [Pusillimonas noertemannii]TFL11868.1 glycoside hydrolase family 19 protein [Pusillimonas noertemannii]
MTKDQFRAATRLSAAMADLWYEPVERAMFEFAIVSPYRAAMFLATIGHESGDFVHTREIWGPTLAQQRYEGRADLGNTQPGDGSRYRGRGLIQITGRANYAEVSRGLGVDFLSQPSRLEETEHAARSAAWWWASNGLNELADTGDFRAVTRRVNGGYNGMADRQRRYELAIKVLG